MKSSSASPTSPKRRWASITTPSALPPSRFPRWLKASSASTPRACKARTSPSIRKSPTVPCGASPANCASSSPTSSLTPSMPCLRAAGSRCASRPIPPPVPAALAFASPSPITAPASSPATWSRSSSPSSAPSRQPEPASASGSRARLPKSTAATCVSAAAPALTAITPPPSSLCPPATRPSTRSPPPVSRSRPCYHQRSTPMPEATETRREIQVEIPAEVVARQTETILEKYQKLARIPGFRRGRVPQSILRQRFAEEIKSEVVEALVPRYFLQEAEKQGLQPVSQPRVTDLNVNEGEPLRFKAEFEVLPPIELADYQGLRLQPPDASVSDDEV